MNIYHVGHGQFLTSDWDVVLRTIGNSEGHVYTAWQTDGPLLLHTHSILNCSSFLISCYQKGLS